MNNIGKIVNAVRFIGIANTFHSVRYALQKETIERRHPAPAFDHPPARPGNLLSSHADSNPIQLQFQSNALEIFIFGPNRFRFTWQPGELPIPYAIAHTPVGFDEFSTDRHPDRISIQTSCCRVEVMQDGAVNAYNAAGNLVRSERPPAFFSPGWQTQAEFHPHEAVFGLGLRASNLNLRGGRYSAWNTDPGGVYDPGDDPLYFSIPTFMGVSPAGSYLLFYENYHRGEFDFSKLSGATFTGGALRYYLFVGSPAEILAGYQELTGYSPLPPRWSLGYHQSRWGYKAEADIRELADRFRQHDLKLDAVHLDIDYMDGYRVFTTDPERFPDLAGLSRDLEDEGIKLVTILDPGVKIDPNYRVFEQGRSEGLFLKDEQGQPVEAPVWPGWCVFPDFGQDRTRSWWGEQYAHLLAKGIAGFWHDMNEPAAFPAWGDPTLPSNTVHQLEGTPVDHQAGHNLFGLLMNRAGYEGLRKLAPDRRPWVLSRSGWAGNQRFAWNWTGDVNSSWEALQQVVSTMLNLTLSGQYYSGSDIGGFSAHPDAELYLRWFQLGAVSPFFRLHSATGLPPREPWHFDENILAIVRQAIELRHRLMPYLYTLAFLASSQGQPIIRPLFWDDPSNVDFYGINDQFFLGQHVLVAPVLRPGVSSRTVLLPDGKWYDFWTAACLEGPGPVKILTDYTHIPMYIRQGAVLPILEREGLVLRVYTDRTIGDFQPVESLIYSDAGDGYGAFRLDAFKHSCVGEGCQLTWSTSGEYPFPHQMVTFEFIGAEIRELDIDGKTITVSDSRLPISAFSQLKYKLTP